MKSHFFTHSLVRKYLKRARPVRELYTTEKTYVEILDAVVNHFLLPMTNEKVADPSQIRTIFSNVQIIFMLNSTLLSDMEERIKIWDSEQIIGDIFIQIVRFCYDLISFNSLYISNGFEILKDRFFESLH